MILFEKKAQNAVQPKQLVITNKIMYCSYYDRYRSYCKFHEGQFKLTNNADQDRTASE